MSQFKAQSKERLEERQAKVTEGLEREDILLSEDFNNAINATTPETINLPQKDAVKYYNDLYGDYGFTFREAGSGMGDAIEGFVLLSDGTVKTKRFNINSMFVNNADTAENIQEFVKTYATTPDEDRSIIESNDMKSAIRAQNLRDVARKNEDGTESTVLFESAVIDGKNVVYPTLFPINPELKTSDPDFWNELDGMEH